MINAVGFIQKTAEVWVEGGCSSANQSEIIYATKLTGLGPLIMLEK